MVCRKLLCSLNRICFGFQMGLAAEFALCRFRYMTQNQFVFWANSRKQHNFAMLFLVYNAFLTIRNLRKSQLQSFFFRADGKPVTISSTRLESCPPTRRTSFSRSFGRFGSVSLISLRPRHPAAASLMIWWWCDAQQAQVRNTENWSSHVQLH